MTSLTPQLPNRDSTRPSLRTSLPPRSEGEGPGMGVLRFSRRAWFALEH